MFYDYTYIKYLKLSKSKKLKIEKWLPMAGGKGVRKLVFSR